MRKNLNCRPFARVSNYPLDAATKWEVERVFQIWKECLERSGGPFLFSDFGIADCMYFPVITRLATYGVPLPSSLAQYADAMWQHAAVKKWWQKAVASPRIFAFDQKIRERGGDPDAAIK